MPPQRRSVIRIEMLTEPLERRLQWLIDFAERDPGSLADDGRAIAALLGSPDGSTTSRESVVAAQAALRQCIDGLIRRAYATLPLPASSTLTFIVTEAPVHPGRSQPKSGWARSRGRIQQQVTGPLSIRLVLEFIRLLERVGADRLMGCPLQMNEQGAQCGRVFLARRRQRYCTVEHSREAAMRAFRARQLERAAAARRPRRKR
jgi:hypothetical protein